MIQYIFENIFRVALKTYKNINILYCVLGSPVNGTYRHRHRSTRTPGAFYAIVDGRVQRITQPPRPRPWRRI